jgi:hypothetical protein
MIVLDADGLMSAAAMLRLVGHAGNPVSASSDPGHRPAGRERFPGSSIRHAPQHAHPHHRDRLVAGRQLWGHNAIIRLPLHRPLPPACSTGRPPRRSWQ